MEHRPNCWAIRVDAAVLCLRLMGMHSLAIRLLEGKGPDEAIAFAEELRSVLAMNDAFLAFTAKHSFGLTSVSLYEFTIRDEETGWEASVGKAFRTLERVVKWHRMTGSMGWYVERDDDILNEVVSG